MEALDGLREELAHADLAHLPRLAVHRRRQRDGVRDDHLLDGALLDAVGGGRVEEAYSLHTSAMYRRPLGDLSAVARRSLGGGLKRPIHSSWSRTPTHEFTSPGRKRRPWVAKAKTRDAPNDLSAFVAMKRVPACSQLAL